ncbi:DUF1003 domain-containing protein [Subtercola sp. RTI3]|nr:DUF1003 domain-containing protein [Subtercola sp. RTI3]
MWHGDHSPLERGSMLGNYFGADTSYDLSVPVSQRRLPRNLNRRGDLLGRVAEATAEFFGTPRFLGIMAAFVAGWLIINTLTPWQFDPYTFTFLTLLLSIQASFSSPLILLAQYRQADRDRVQFEQDRQNAERNLADVEYLARELAAVRLTSAATLKIVEELRRQLHDQAATVKN